MTLLERLRATVLDAATAGPEVGGRPAGDDIDLSELSGISFTPAAVLIPVVRRAQPTVLLTRRTDSLRRHAGQVAFPGGRIDPEDEGPIAAALREAHEEVALPPHLVDVLGTIDSFHTGTGYHITPVVGLVPPDVPLAPAEAEVAALFEVPLAHLMDPLNHRVEQAEFRGRMRTFHVIDWETHRIWGATAGIIVSLANRLKMYA